MRTAILEGRIKAGEKVPSTRELALRLGVSRNVVLEAYDLLIAEGYLEGRHGSGTSVAEGIFLEGTNATRGVPTCSVRLERPKDRIDFRSGVPALDLFPLRQWGQLLHSVCLDALPAELTYDRPEGRIELRQGIANHLYKSRGIRCNPESLFITSGATQGLSITARILFSPGSIAAVEDPLNDGMRQIFAYSGYQLYPVPVDGLGISVDLLPTNQQIRFIYVTPSHQFPLGGLLPIQRRIGLIDYARRMGCYIIEDDYDSEFRYSGQPVSSLLELAPDRVIYIGSFSKILAPALRLGFVILPPELVGPYQRLKRVTDVHTSLWEQLALGRFIEKGGLERQITALRKVYGRRRNCLIQALELCFPGQVRILGDATGLHLIAEFNDYQFPTEVIGRIKKFGVKVYSVDQHAIQKGVHLHQVILGYGHLKEEQIQEGVRRLHEALKSIGNTDV